MLIYVIAIHRCLERPVLTASACDSQGICTKIILEHIGCRSGSKAVTLSCQRFKFETHNGKGRDNGREVELAVPVRDFGQ